MPPTKSCWIEIIDHPRRRLLNALAADPADPRSWDTAAMVLFALLVGLLGLTFHSYGISTDEYVQQVYGEKLWAFYLSGFADRSAFHYDNLYLYGGLFDMTAVALQHLLPFEPYDTRHLLCGLIGVLGIAGTWRLAREVAGPRVGFLAAALLALTASWYGAMFNNTKDIPFATGMVWALYFSCLLVAELPRPRLRHVLCFGVALGVALSVRVGAVFLVFYLAIAVMMHGLAVARQQGWRAAARDLWQATLALAPAAPLAYAIMAVFWPWSVMSPLDPLLAIAQLTNFPIPTELDDRFYRATDLPSDYLPVYVAIKVPEITLLGLAILAGWAGLLLRRGRVALSSRALQAAVVVCSVAIPVLYFVVMRPSLYNGMRHFFFIVPPLCIGAAVGLNQLWSWAAAQRRWGYSAVAATLLFVASHQIVNMIRLHPHEYIYYNALVGGPGGAFRRYEMDYWSNFLPQALDLLEQQLKAEHGGKPPVRRYLVGLCTKEEILGEYAPPYLVPTKDWRRADFIIATTNTDCDKYAGGRTVIEIVREGAVLGMVKDRRPGTTALSNSSRPLIR
ncbi:MAG: glycosyltransferase family 39 protein [Rhodospirillales bacterium]